MEEGLTDKTFKVCLCQKLFVGKIRNLKNLLNMHCHRISLGGIYNQLPKAGMCWACITFSGCMGELHVMALPGIVMETVMPGQ